MTRNKAVNLKHNWYNFNDRNKTEYSILPFVVIDQRSRSFIIDAIPTTFLLFSGSEANKSNTKKIKVILMYIFVFAILFEQNKLILNNSHTYFLEHIKATIVII